MAKSDFHHIKDSGKACVACGRTSDRILLTRLDTYARAYACTECFKQYWNCGAPGCGHFPHPHGQICSECGCEMYIHGLAAEFDRQYAAGVGLAPRIKECTGYGINLGKCGRIVLVKPDGTLGRLCDSCEDRWKREAIEGAREAKLLHDLDTNKKETPN